MNIRTRWTDYDKKTRKYIKARDKNKCLICMKIGGLQIAHIFLSRAQGGRGCKENGVLLCVKCHQILDNPIGKQEEKSKFYLDACKNYLKQVEALEERFDNEKDLIDNWLKFDKSKIEKTLEVIDKNIIKEDRCEKCKYLKKRVFRGLPTYICLKKEKVIGKKSRTCQYFKKGV